MFKLDNAFLEELGLGSLPPVEKNKMLAHIYETLEMRVGMKLAEQMSNEQLDEFESYINAQDEAGALKWLETNFPNYKQVVADELEKLKVEISQVAPQIVAQAQEAIAAQSGSEPMTNTNGVFSAPQGTGQGSTAGQPAPQLPQQPVTAQAPVQPQTPQQAPAPVPEQPQYQQPAQVPPANFDPVQEPGSEPMTNTNGVNYASPGASQGSTAGQPPQQQQAPAPQQPWQPEQ